MRFINTDQMSFLGPGSEWFWTAVSGLVLAVTFVAIYRQLRLQASADANEQLARMEQDYGSEYYLRLRISAYKAMRDGKGPEDLPDGARTVVSDWWERIALLARAGHIDTRLINDLMGGVCQGWWHLARPWVELSRTRTHSPEVHEHFEWLAAQMAKIDQRRGLSFQPYPATDAEFEFIIGRLTGEVQVAEATRRVVFVAEQPVNGTPA